MRALRVLVASLLLLVTVTSPAAAYCGRTNNGNSYSLSNTINASAGVTFDGADGQMRFMSHQVETNQILYSALRVMGEGGLAMVAIYYWSDGTADIRFLVTDDLGFQVLNVYIDAEDFAFLDPGDYIDVEIQEVGLGRWYLKASHGAQISEWTSPVTYTNNWLGTTESVFAFTTSLGNRMLGTSSFKFALSQLKYDSNISDGNAWSLNNTQAVNPRPSDYALSEDTLDGSRTLIWDVDC